MDYLFDLGRDHVAASEIRVVEYLAEDALSEEMLDQHALYGFFGEIRVDGLTAKGVEVVEAADEKRDSRRRSVINGLLDSGS